jgi:hypothetical protein
MTRVSGNHKPKEAEQMETAKVDIRKLQLLNDRINQCIDALNQVRLSVHGLSQGLSHTSGQGSQYGLGSQYGQGAQGFGANPFTQGVNPFTQGLNPFTQAGASPFGFGSQGIGQMPLGQSPWNQGFVPGLSHTGGQSLFGQQGINPYLSGMSPEALEASVRPIWADPVLTARITQTFPYAQFPVPPVVTIY